MGLLRPAPVCITYTAVILLHVLSSYAPAPSAGPGYTDRAPVAGPWGTVFSAEGCPWSTVSVAEARRVWLDLLRWW